MQSQRLEALVGDGRYRPRQSMGYMIASRGRISVWTVMVAWKGCYKDDWR